MLKTILVDDERPALKALEHLLKLFPDVEIIGAFTDVNEALPLLKDNHIQLLFLDIDMPQHNGIDVAKKVLAETGDIDIVFVTAYNHFAVDAFEVNATDYILKPVSPKRLERTMERISKKRLVADSSALQQKRTAFLNHILAGKISDQQEISSQASLLGIDFTQSFSCFFLLMQDEKQLAIHILMAEWVITPGLVAWETPHGIGILDYTLSDGGDWKNAELLKASQLQATVAGYLPGSNVAIGIAERYTKNKDFVDHYLQARNAVIIGLRIAPSQGLYHFQDSGFLPILDRYIDKQYVDHLIERTIGKILEYDQLNGTELFRTMEQIILCNNLQDVAHTLFIHYKTVQFRKQQIEKILEITINSFQGRTMLGVALTLFYLRDARQ